MPVTADSLEGKTFEGTISYDSTDIRNFDIEKLNQKISLIHQNIYMFDDTISQNIRLYEDFTDYEMEKALSASGVSKFLPQMPSGLNSPAGENGCSLSGGQRQRVAVARALIREKPILILDEGTSAIDMQTAYDIENSLLKVSDLTLITITHNMSQDLLGLYDCIIYMEDGRVAETGSLDELLARQSSFYHFFHLQ
jgi:ABC-type multidrug transport system fused ATPase/permease subunit